MWTTLVWYGKGFGPFLRLSYWQIMIIWSVQACNTSKQWCIAASWYFWRKVLMLLTWGIDALGACIVPSLLMTDSSYTTESCICVTIRTLYSLGLQSRLNEFLIKNFFMIWFLRLCTWTSLLLFSLPYCFTYWSWCSS